MKILQNTFAHTPGVSIQTEQRIWRSDIFSWHEFLDKGEQLPLRSHQKRRLVHQVRNSIVAHKNEDYSFFLRSLPQNLHWRLYPELKRKCCFVDIETEGLSKERNDITVIGLYDGKESKFFVHGKNLDEFPQEMQKYDAVVTFNGRCFDLPFIQAKFPSLDLNKFHVDLRFAMKEIGYTGGLKRIEKMLGIDRGEELAEVDGYEAVRLWKRYQKGDLEALELLIKYNQADIENLKTLMDFTFEKLREKQFLNHMNV